MFNFTVIFRDVLLSVVDRLELEDFSIFYDSFQTINTVLLSLGMNDFCNFWDYYDILGNNNNNNN